MGFFYGAICEKCGHAFEVHEGGGAAFLVLHCDQCGAQRNVFMTEMGSAFFVGEDPSAPARWIAEHVDPCSCGGRFTLDAPPRCPKCSSKNLKRDPENLGGICD